MTKRKDPTCGCQGPNTKYKVHYPIQRNVYLVLLLPTNVVDITVCYIEIRFAQNTTQTLIGCELETTPASINVLVGRQCHVNIPTACLTRDRFVVRRYV